MKNEFVMFVGPMFGGKTTKLLSAIDRYKYQGRKILTFKPDVDERYSKEEIVTHWNTRVPAKRISNGQELIAELKSLPYHSPREKLTDVVIAVDESFMIPGVGKALIELFKAGHTVVVSSLQLSSDFTPYEEMQAMMPYATKVEVCPAVCSTCGSDAFYTRKTGGRSDHQIEVGGAEMYQPKCLKHFST
jgi:thymidine kinase